MQRAAEYEEAVPAQAHAAPQAPGFSMPVTGKSLSLEEAISQMDESFSEMLLRKIDEKGMTDAQCYKKANIDRSFFPRSAGINCISHQSLRPLLLPLLWNLLWMRQRICL